MANILNKFLGYLKLGDEDELDDFENEFEEKEQLRRPRMEKVNHSEKLEQQRERTEKKISNRLSQGNRNNSDSETIAEPKRERSVKMERTSNNKIIPIRTTPKGLEVCIMKPTSFEDSQDICDMLLTGRASVVNLEGFDPDDAQRIMDFISGCVYAINGKLHQISRYIFIFSPDTIDISGDYLEFMPEEGFEVPTLNKEF